MAECPRGPQRGPRGFPPCGLPEYLRPGGEQRAVEVGHRRRNAARGETGDAMRANATRHDAREMRKLRGEIDCDPVRTDPAADAHADGRELFLPGTVHHPEPDPIGPPLGWKAERGERKDQPLLDPVHQGMNVVRCDSAMATTEIEHEIGDALTGSMICPLSAAPGPEDRKRARIDEIIRARRSAGRVHGRMFKKPDKVACRSLADGLNPRLHAGHCLGIGNETGCCLEGGRN